jgi:hypothetical protein
MIPRFINLLMYLSRICSLVLGVKTLRVTSSVIISYFFSSCWEVGSSMASLL